MKQGSVLFQLVGMVVLYVLLLLVVFKGYKGIMHKSMNPNRVTPVAILCLGISLTCTLLVTYVQKGG